MTQAQPETPVLETTVPARLLSVPLAATFAAEFASLTSFFLLLSVMPMLAAAAGASSSGAGLITGSLLLGTVVAEVAAAASIRRFAGLGQAKPRAAYAPRPPYARSDSPAVPTPESGH